MACNTAWLCKILQGKVRLDSSWQTAFEVFLPLNIPRPKPKEHVPSQLHGSQISEPEHSSEAIHVDIKDTSIWIVHVIFGPKWFMS